jgi:hypothetical protein
VIAVYLASAALPGVHPVFLAVSCFIVVFVFASVSPRRLSRMERRVIAAVLLAVALTAIDQAVLDADGCKVIEPKARGSGGWLAAGWPNATVHRSRSDPFGAPDDRARVPAVVRGVWLRPVCGEPVTRHEALRALLAQPDEALMPKRAHRYIKGMHAADPVKTRQSYIVRVLRSVVPFKRSA